MSVRASVAGSRCRWACEGVMRAPWLRRKRSGWARSAKWETLGDCQATR